MLHGDEPVAPTLGPKLLLRVKTTMPGFDPGTTYVRDWGVTEDGLEDITDEGTGYDPCRFRFSATASRGQGFIAGEHNTGLPNGLRNGAPRGTVVEYPAGDPCASENPSAAQALVAAGTPPWTHVSWVGGGRAPNEILYVEQQVREPKGPHDGGVLDYGASRLMAATKPGKGRQPPRQLAFLGDGRIAGIVPPAPQTSAVVLAVVGGPSAGLLCLQPGMPSPTRGEGGTPVSAVCATPSHVYWAAGGKLRRAPVAGDACGRDAETADEVDGTRIDWVGCDGDRVVYAGRHEAAGTRYVFSAHLSGPGVDDHLRPQNSGEVHR